MKNTPIACHYSTQPEIYRLIESCPIPPCETRPTLEHQEGVGEMLISNGETQNLRISINRAPEKWNENAVPKTPDIYLQARNFFHARFFLKELKKKDIKYQEED